MVVWWVYDMHVDCNVDYLGKGGWKTCEGDWWSRRESRPWARVGACCAAGTEGDKEYTWGRDSVGVLCHFWMLVTFIFILNVIIGDVCLSPGTASKDVLFSSLFPLLCLDTPSQLTALLTSNYHERIHPDGTCFNPKTPQVHWVTADRIHKVLLWVSHCRPQILCGVQNGPSLPTIKQRPTDSSSPTTRTNAIAISSPSR